MRKILFLMLFLLASMGLKSQTASDSIVASLLTCSPGTETYALYGHTGLRMRNVTQGVDLVFNYGVFDFRRPNFTWHFILGECDYEVDGYPFEVFMQEYYLRGSSVVEQTLNLSMEEANRLYALMIINCQKENRTYRYNFLQTNCTTKARDQIEEAVDGNVVYEEREEHVTYRQLLRRQTEQYPWSEVGNDLLLGADCDTVLSDRAAQFLPHQLMEYFAQAQIYDAQNNRKPLVARTQVLLEGRPQSVPQVFPLSPLEVGLLTVVVFVLIALLEFWSKRMFWIWDILVMVVQGLAGLLLCFMFLFSEHPTVDSNWQIWLFNPLPLICMPWVVKCAFRHRRCLYHYLNSLSLVLFLVFMVWIPQSFSALTLPLALALLTRPVSYLMHYSRTTSLSHSENKKTNTSR